MKKASRIIFLLVGTIFPIFAGSIHTYAHFSELTIPEVQQLLNTQITISGQDQIVYVAWGFMSFMMGAAFIIIGLLNLVAFRKLDKEDWPPVSNLLVMVLYILATIYTSITFPGEPQLYGSLFGLTLAFIAIGIIVTQKNKIALA